MNHVDIDRKTEETPSLCSRIIQKIMTTLRPCLRNTRKIILRWQKYVINLGLYQGAKGESGSMPCNSDHCPFVYSLDGGKIGRARMLAVAHMSITYLDDMSRFNEESRHFCNHLWKLHEVPSIQP